MGREKWSKNEVGRDGLRNGDGRVEVSGAEIGALRSVAGSGRAAGAGSGFVRLREGREENLAGGTLAGLRGGRVEKGGEGKWDEWGE